MKYLEIFGILLFTLLVIVAIYYYLLVYKKPLPPPPVPPPVPPPPHMDKNCSGNGVWTNGRCKCIKGYRGYECQIKCDEDRCKGKICGDDGCGGTCEPGCEFEGGICGENGTKCVKCTDSSCGPNEKCDDETKKCVCKDTWTGDDCKTSKCKGGCINGTCTESDEKPGTYKCVCDEGFTGYFCNVKCADNKNNDKCEKDSDCCGDGDFTCENNRCKPITRACYFAYPNDAYGQPCPVGTSPIDSRCGELIGKTCYNSKCFRGSPGSVTGTCY